MIVVDTNVLSELMRSAPHPEVVAWARATSGPDLCTTSITLAEILYGIERLPTGWRKERVKIAATDVFSSFAERVLPFDALAAVQYGGIVTLREHAGEPIDGFDAQIASICRANHATLATRNVKHFQNIGIDVLDPWRPAG